MNSIIHSAVSIVAMDRKPSISTSEWIVGMAGKQGEQSVSSRHRGYIIASRDITGRKEYERELRRERDRLERLSGFVSHDLGDPLNVAEDHLELAQKKCACDHLNGVAQSLDWMHELIFSTTRNQLLSHTLPIATYKSIQATGKTSNRITRWR